MTPPSPTTSPRQAPPPARVSSRAAIGKDATGFGLAVILRVELPESLAGETGNLLVKQAHEVCPHSKATRGNIDVELVVEWSPRVPRA